MCDWPCKTFWNIRSLSLTSWSRWPECDSTRSIYCHVEPNPDAPESPELLKGDHLTRHHLKYVSFSRAFYFKHNFLLLFLHNSHGTKEIPDCGNLVRGGTIRNRMNHKGGSIRNRLFNSGRPIWIRLGNSGRPIRTRPCNLGGAIRNSCFAKCYARIFVNLSDH